MQVDIGGLAASIKEAIRGPRTDELRFCVDEMARHIRRSETGGDFVVSEAWDEQYDRMERAGIVLIDLGLTCTRMRGQRWHAKVTRGYGASGHGKGNTPAEAVDKAVADFDRSHKVWENLPSPKMPSMLEDEQKPLDLDSVPSR